MKNQPSTSFTRTLSRQCSKSNLWFVRYQLTITGCPAGNQSNNMSNTSWPTTYSLIISHFSYFYQDLKSKRNSNSFGNIPGIRMKRIHMGCLSDKGYFFSLSNVNFYYLVPTTSLNRYLPQLYHGFDKEF